MPQTALTDEYNSVRGEYEKAARALVPLLIEMALESIAEVLPGAHELDVVGEINEDWIPILRIQRVLDDDGGVLFDIAFGHHEEAVEDLIDQVGSEYLGLLLDLTGDDFMGAKTIDREWVES